MEDIERKAAAVAAMSWDLLTDQELAAAYLSATFGGPPKIRRENLAFQKALDLSLIGADGSMHELVFKGLEAAAGRLGVSGGSL